MEHAPPRSTSGLWEQLRSERAALIVFVAVLVAAVPIVLAGVGSYHWFLRDDFYFLAGRSARSWDDLFRPHSSHWSTVPVLAYRALFAVFGMRSYAPYQAGVLALHLGVCVLLRVIMRRVGVGPWVATVAAASFVLFGPGEQNIIWGFQIGFTGSMAWGLAQLVLADHDGPVNKRDGFALLAGALALMSSGVGIVMVIVTGFAMLGRRGYRVAALQTAPLGALYLVWWIAERPELSSPVGRPSAETLVGWVRSSEIGNFLGIGHYQSVAALLVVVLAVGVVLAWWGLDWTALRRRASVPVALVLGAVLFSVTTALGRWFTGVSFARSSRYVYIGVALTLPVLAVAIDAIMRRWRAVGVVAVALLLVAIPWNATHFAEDSVFGRDYMQSTEHVLTNVVRIPDAARVPRDVRPINDSFVGPDLTIGFLLDAVKAGKLDPSSEPMTVSLANEMRVRVGVAFERRGTAANCRVVSGPLDVDPAQGTRYTITTPVKVTTRAGGEVTSNPVPFPANGTLTIELAGMHLRLEAVRGQTFSLCSVVFGRAAKEIHNHSLVLFGVRQAPGPTSECRVVRGRLDVRPEKGTVYGIDSPVGISTREGHRSTSKPIVFDPAKGRTLTIALDDLLLRFAPPPGADSFTVCSAGKRTS